jgi:hypothetical protein
MFQHRTKTALILVIKKWVGLTADELLGVLYPLW